MIKSINLRTGIFPVYYGDRLSSACDITYGFTDDKTAHLGLKLGTTGINAVIGKNIHSKLRMLLAVRKQSYDFFGEAFFINGNFLSDYRDVQGLIKYKATPCLSFEAISILADSRYRVEPSDSTYHRYGNYGVYYGPGDYEQHR